MDASMDTDNASAGEATSKCTVAASAQQSALRRRMPQGEVSSMRDWSAGGKTGNRHVFLPPLVGRLCWALWHC
eukprot:1796413-Amphidinium_carterae.1